MCGMYAFTQSSLDRVASTSSFRGLRELGSIAAATCPIGDPSKQSEKIFRLEMLRGRWPEFASHISDP
jgi:hypothetical protein